MFQKWFWDPIWGVFWGVAYRIFRPYLHVLPVFTMRALLHTGFGVIWQRHKWAPDHGSLNSGPDYVQWAPIAPLYALYLECIWSVFGHIWTGLCTKSTYMHHIWPHLDMSRIGYFDPLLHFYQCLRWVPFCRSVQKWRNVQLPAHGPDYAHL